MRKIVFFLFFSPALIAKGEKLKVGERYDFIAKDGQHVYDAILVRETQTTYVVKVAGFGNETVTVEKSILSEPPKQIQPGKPRPRRGPPEKMTVALYGDFRIAIGDFSNYTQFFPGGGLRLTRTIPRLPVVATNALWAAFHYAPVVKSPRRIDMVTGMVGPRWNFRWKKWKSAELFVAAGPSLSFFKYVSFSYEAISFNVGAVAGGGFDWYMGKNWFLSLQAMMHYVYDSQTLILLPAVSAGVGYAW